MKYIKTFEQISEYKPEIGDYVILDTSPGTGIPEIYGTNVGKITNLLTSDKHATLVWIEYDDNIEPIKYYHYSWIKYMSKDKEELESMLAAKKYNL